MRIHIVQKGDTLWKIAKKYGVDFEELKSVNTQLSNPDMIMPGMKIKVPQGKKQVKKEAPKQAAPKKEMPSTPPYKDTSPKPIPSIKEDEKKPVTKGPMQKPMQPINMSMPISMPSIDQQMQNYYTTFHLPQMPTPQQPKEEVEESPKEAEVKPAQYAPMPQQPYGPPMQPQLVHSDFYCCPPYPVMMPMHHQQPMPAHMMPQQHQQPMPAHMMPQQPQSMPMWDDDDSGDDLVQGAQAGSDCGCGGGQSPQAYGPMMGYGGPPPQGFQQQPHYGPVQHPMGWGQMPHPQMEWGQQPQQGPGQPQQGPGQPQPQMGQWNPQQSPMDQGYSQPWREDDVDES